MQVVKKIPLWRVLVDGNYNRLYTVAMVHEMLDIGQINTHARVSRDGVTWEPLHQVPELLPASVLTGEWVPDPTPETRYQFDGQGVLGWYLVTVMVGALMFAGWVMP